MKEQIWTLFRGGKTRRAIAKALGISKNTVKKILKEADDNENTNAVPLTYSLHDQSLKPGLWLKDFPWQEVIDKRRRGYSVESLFQAYSPPVSYFRFAAVLRRQLGKTAQVALRLHHLAGEKAYVDYADGISFKDQHSNIFKTQLFCGVLPFSSKTFAEFSLSQKKDSFLKSHENMFYFFGGVPSYVVTDNLKSAVTKAHLYDPDINPTYCEFANHYGFAVLPARPKTPRDKAAVECAIGVIQRSFYQHVKDKVFSSLAELNGELKLFLKELNETVMKDYGVSRNDRFALEKEKLQPLPESVFTMTEHLIAKVHPDCHIQVKKSFYSVPFCYVGQEVRVKLSGKLLDVYSENLTHITCHVKASAVGKFVTKPDHLPPSAMQANHFLLEQARRQAQAIGPGVSLFVAESCQDSRPLRKLRLIQGVIRLYQSGKVTAKALEFACGQALQFKKLRYQFISQCAQNYMVQGGTELKIIAPQRHANQIYLHEKGHL